MHRGAVVDLIELVDISSPDALFCNAVMALKALLETGHIATDHVQLEEQLLDTLLSEMKGHHDASIRMQCTSGLVALIKRFPEQDAEVRAVNLSVRHPVLLQTSRSHLHAGDCVECAPSRACSSAGAEGSLLVQCIRRSCLVACVRELATEDVGGATHHAACLLVKLMHSDAAMIAAAQDGGVLGHLAMMSRMQLPVSAQVDPPCLCVNAGLKGTPVNAGFVCCPGSGVCLLIRCSKLRCWPRRFQAWGDMSPMVQVDVLDAVSLLIKDSEDARRQLVYADWEDAVNTQPFVEAVIASMQSGTMKLQTSACKCLRW